MAFSSGSKRKEPWPETALSIKRLRVEELSPSLDGMLLHSYADLRLLTGIVDGTTTSTEDADSPNTSASLHEQPTTDSSTPLTSAASTPSNSFPCRKKNLICDFPGCGKTYNRPVRLAEHQRSHTNERPFKCERDGCDKAFFRDSHLKAHVKSHHEDRRDWECDWPGCGQGFATGQRMRNHRKRHEEKEQLKCTGYPPCEQFFRKPETLQRHVESVHLQDKPYACDHVDKETGAVCGRKFNQPSSLKQHFEREHSGNRFWCTICSPNESGSPNDDNGPVELLEAGVGYATYGQLQEHIKIEHPPTCTVCGYLSTTAAQLRAHIDIEHGSLEERRNFVCDYAECDRSFTSKGNLMVHKKSVHDKLKFICGQVDLSQSKTALGWNNHGACGGEFSTKATLERHVRSRHLHLPELPKGKEKRRQRRERMGNAAHDPSSFDTSVANHDGYGLLDTQYSSADVLLACIVFPCPHRSTGPLDLELHLESAHGFNSLAAMEAAIEQEAKSGGQFWIGGSGNEQDGEDYLLAQRLQVALSSDANSLPE